jgi:hypothetical protein
VITDVLASGGSGTGAGKEVTVQDDTPVIYEAPDDHAQYSEVRGYTLKEPLRDLLLEGVVVAAISTEDAELPRWTTMELYRTTDGRYVYYRIGHSLVYHDPGTTLCRTGVLMRPEDLPEDAEPCPKCRPASDPDAPVHMEEDLPAIFICTDVAGVVQALVKTRNGSATISRPAQRLLADAARRDENFLSYRRVERI